MSRICLPLLVVLVLSSCKSSLTQLHESYASGASASPAWIAKLARVLRAGDGIGRDDDMAALSSMSEDEVIAAFMQDPRFYDTVINFGLFYHHRSLNQLRGEDPRGGRSSNGRYRDFLFEFPTVLAAAKAVEDDGDFFAIFSPLRTAVLPPLGPPTGMPDTVRVWENENERRTEMARYRNLQLETNLRQFDQRIAKAQSKQDLCNDLLAYRSEDPATKYSRASALLRIELLVSGFPRQLDRALNRGLTDYMYRQCEQAEVSFEQIKQGLAEFRAGLTELYRVANERSVAPFTSRRSVADLFSAPNQLGPVKLLEEFSLRGQWQQLPNSSTNLNRRRASYVLKTYFCDDLEPLELVVEAEPHAGNRHASEPSCRSCHYKLDPVGALFRQRGQEGRFLLAKHGMLFDDDLYLNPPTWAAKVEQTWGDGQGGILAGYMLAPGQKDPAWQGGSQLEDLWNYLPKSKAAKQCLVRRMAEYFLGTDQAYDAAWLEEISQDFRPGPRSAKAFKKVVASLVKSKTFKTQDPIQGECYDFASSSAAQSAVPCPVRHIFEQRCVECHGQENSSSDHLDLSQWVDDGAGGSNFRHLVNGRQQTFKQTAEAIRGRINSSDSELRMPYKTQPLSDHDRARINRWLLEENQ